MDLTFWWFITNVPPPGYLTRLVNQSRLGLWWLEVKILLLDMLLTQACRMCASGVIPSEILMDIIQFMAILFLVQICLCLLHCRDNFYPVCSINWVADILQMEFLNVFSSRRVLHFEKSMSGIYWTMCNWQWVNIGFGNGLKLYRRRAVAWMNHSTVLARINTSNIFFMFTKNSWNLLINVQLAVSQQWLG